MSPKGKRVSALVALVLASALTVFLWNYVALQAPMNEVLSADSRNQGIVVKTHFASYCQPSALVFDLQEISGDKSPADVFRVLLQYAAAVQEREFKTVHLNHLGKLKFALDGSYFKRLGSEYGTQNPVYTMRTLPENLFLPSGERAYGTWTGGLLGVLEGQVDDFNNFHQKWYLEDLTSR